MSSEDKEPIVDKMGIQYSNMSIEWLMGCTIWEKECLVGVALYKISSVARAVRDIC